MRGRGDSVFTRIQEILLHSVCEKTVGEKIYKIAALLWGLSMVVRQVENTKQV